MKGFFVTFEGGDGSGKSTLMYTLSEALQKAGHDVVVTREPGGTAFSEKVRSLLLIEGNEISAKTELLLVLAARNEHMEKVILPALQKGCVVLCDRFVDSTVVYQGYAAGHDPAAVEAMANEIIPRLPDCTFLLDLPVEESVQRRKGRDAVIDKMEQKDCAFHEEVRRGFLAVAKAHPERICILDARETVSALCQKALSILVTKRAVL